MTTSATGGYLTPTEPPSPLEDDALDDFLQKMVVGITGLPGDLVRPRWQPVPPQQPPADTDWAAFGILNRTPDANAAITHHPEGQGNDELQRHEELEILASFYGPHCQQHAGRLRDGLSIAQNREAMFLNKMGLVEVGMIRSFPELVNQQWIKRADLSLTIRRQIIRDYAVLNIVSAEGTISADKVEAPSTQAFIVES